MNETYALFKKPSKDPTTIRTDSELLLNQFSSNRETSIATYVHHV